MKLEHTLTFSKGNILNSKAELLVNPVNTVGVMGAGLAEQFRKKFPQNYKTYVEHCSNVTCFNDYKYHAHKEKGKVIFNFASKEHFNKFSSLGYIRRSLINLVIFLEKNPTINSIAIPPVGCGLGGLSQKNVLHLIIYYLRQVPRALEVELFGFKDVRPLIKNHILKYYDLSYRSVERYTGVGSRELDREGLGYVRDVANNLLDHGYVLVTGDASRGCDFVFWEHAVSPYRKRYGPFGKSTYEDEVVVVPPGTDHYDKAHYIAGLTHPAWRWIPDWMKELHTRNVFQVLGEFVSDPTEFLVCWTPDGAETAKETSKKTGGTGTAIRIADKFGVPVFNLKRHDAIPRLEHFLNIKIKRIYSLPEGYQDHANTSDQNFAASLQF